MTLIKFEPPHPHLVAAADWKTSGGGEKGWKYRWLLLPSPYSLSTHSHLLNPPINYLCVLQGLDQEKRGEVIKVPLGRHRHSHLWQLLGMAESCCSLFPSLGIFVNFREILHLEHPTILPLWRQWLSSGSPPTILSLAPGHSLPCCHIPPPASFGIWGCPRQASPQAHIWLRRNSHPPLPHCLWMRSLLPVPLPTSPLSSPPSLTWMICTELLVPVLNALQTPEAHLNLFRWFRYSILIWAKETGIPLPFPMREGKKHPRHSNNSPKKTGLSISQFEYLYTLQVVKELRVTQPPWQPSPSDIAPHFGTYCFPLRF